MTHKISRNLLGLTVGLWLFADVQATQVRVEVENLTGPGGLYFTPVWVGFHGGGFDSFDDGAAASGSLEALAEEGDASGISADFMTAGSGTDGVVFAPAGFPGAPVFDPGDSAGLTLHLDPLAERYFSFLSMVIPSNDAFIGNDNPLAYEIFNAAGDFTGPLEILVLGAGVWDAGTEINDGQGAAFSTAGGTGSDQGGVVGLHPGFTTADILGATTAAGSDIDPVAGDFTTPGYQLARITISQVPEPPLIALLGLGLALVWRRQGGKGQRIETCDA